MTVSRPTAEELVALCDCERDGLRTWLVLMDELAGAERPNQQIRTVAARLAGRAGFSPATIRRKWDAWRRGAHWSCLLDGRSECGAEGRLPEGFLSAWKERCERNQRKCGPAWRQLIAEWRAGKQIDGYPTPPAADPRTGIPAGWGYRNMMRFAPTKYELRATRIGRAAAADLRPLVPTTRVGLAAGQYYVFDDLEHDMLVNVPGVNRRAMRPLELCCLDLFSGCKIAWGLKPTIVGDDGAKQKLKEREMRFLLAYVLTRIGYRPEGTVLCVEHGTAAIRPEIEALLRDCTGGAVTVQRSGIERFTAFAGQYGPAGGGNFRFKAALESAHNLAHNELAALPGQIGQDRQHSPEELAGREKYNTALLRAMAALPPERAALLRLPFCDMASFAQAVDQIYPAINARDDHELEGYIEAGLVANEWRILDGSEDWMPAERILGLQPAEQLAISALLRGNPGLRRQRVLRPVEVWERGRQALARVPGYHAPEILGRDLAAERRAEAGLFEFRDQEIQQGTTFRYLAQVPGPGRIPRFLPDGVYRTFVNPFDLSVMYVQSAEGAWLGECPQWAAVRRDDTETLHRRMGAARAIEGAMLAPVAARGAALVRRQIADRLHNAEVLRGAPVTQEELERASTISGTRLSAEDRRAALGTGDAQGEPGPELTDDDVASARGWGDDPANARVTDEEIAAVLADK